MLLDSLRVMPGVIGQYTRHLRALLYRLFGSFSPAKSVNCYVFIHEDVPLMVICFSNFVIVLINW